MWKDKGKMKFSIITLGCKVNTYESQYYAAQLEELDMNKYHRIKRVIFVSSIRVLSQTQPPANHVKRFIMSNE